MYSQFGCSAERGSGKSPGSFDMQIVRRRWRRRRTTFENNASRRLWLLEREGRIGGRICCFFLRIRLSGAHLNANSSLGVCLLVRCWQNMQIKMSPDMASLIYGIASFSYILILSNRKNPLRILVFGIRANFSPRESFTAQTSSCQPISWREPTFQRKSSRRCFWKLSITRV